MKLASYAKSSEFIGRGLNIFGLKNELVAEIKNRISNNEKISLLEVGCGEGNLLIDLLHMFPSLSLTGINKNSTHGIKSEKEFGERIKERGIVSKKIPKIDFGDATKLPYKDNSFDIVASQVTVLHIKNKAKAIEEIYRVLKTGGVALVAMGPYSIRRKQGYAMSNFYKKLRRKLRFDFNPRFLIKVDNTFIPFSEYLCNFDEKQIELVLSNFTSSSQRGIANWLVIHKIGNDPLNLQLKYLAKESEELTNSYAKANPVNWGVVDVYQFDPQK